MDELRKFLVDNGVLEVFCKVIVDPETRTNTNIVGKYIKGCINSLVSWELAGIKYPEVASSRWGKLHGILSSIPNDTLFDCTREELVSKLRSKKHRLQGMVASFKGTS